LVVVDENVYKIYKDYINSAFKKSNSNIFYYEIKSGEDLKSFNGLTGIISSLVENNFGRDSLLIAIGGGVAGDLSGFAASVYMRGIQLIHVPTTLLAAIDSSVGGKTGINFNKYKNLLGTFYQPELVLIDPHFLTSLPPAEINSGMGELIKYAFLTNEKFFSYLNNNFDKVSSLDKTVLSKLIYESVMFKGSVISEDEYEAELRKILNFGHTFAHAYESHAEFSIRHGEAVCIGIISALILSNRRGFLSEKKLNRFLDLPLKMNLTPTFNNSDYDSIIKFMYGDKKNRKGEIRFVLLKDIGKIITGSGVKESDIVYSIDMTYKILSEKKSQWKETTDFI
jgi:3-dehydroquinate synthase